MANDNLFRNRLSHAYSRTNTEDKATDSFLAIKLMQWLLEFNGIEYSTKDFLEHSKLLVGHMPEIYNFVKKSSEKVNLPIVISDEFSLQNDQLTSDDLGLWFQSSLDKNSRKSKAVNYTQNALTVLSASGIFNSIGSNNITSIADPFCGSGRLITAYLEFCHNNNKLLPSQILVNDIYPLPVLISYCRIVLLLNKFGTKINDIDLDASIGDGFGISKTFDLIIMNPPFTRTHRISKSTKMHLIKLQKQLRFEPEGQPGLHIFALLLTNLLLNDGGDLIAVLPLSTIQSSYTNIIDQIVIPNYQKVKWYFFQNLKSHSDGSEIKEILLFAKDSGKQEIVRDIEFTTISGTKEFEITRSNNISLKQLRQNWNWSTFFSDPKLLSLVSVIVSKAKLRTINELSLTVIRGIELYGPNFFFFPNKFVKLEFNQENVILQVESKNYTVPPDFLHPILRQPKLYKSQITPNVNEYCLSIPDEENMKIEKYAKEHKELAKVAIRKFGDAWIHHTFHQLTGKYPYGHLFIVDKLDLGSTCSLAFFTDDLLPATKNFYVIKSETYKFWQIKLLSAWINSSIFLLLYLHYRREIGGTWGRLQIMDYKKTPLFPDISRFKKEDVQVLLNLFDRLRMAKLPDIISQIGMPLRKLMDEELIKLLSLNIAIDELYNAITVKISMLQIRSGNK